MKKKDRMDHLMKKKDRMDHLLKTWFFKCSCDVCSLTGEESEENDRMRMKTWCDSPLL